MDTRDLDAGASRPAPTGPGATQAVRLRQLDPALARLNQRIGPGLHAELPLGAGRVRLQLGPARPAGPHPPSLPLRLQGPAGVLAVMPARQLVRALSAIDLPGQDDEPDPMQSLRMGVALQAMPPGWLDLFGASSALASGAGEDAGADALELGLSIFEPQARLGLAATLCGSADALLHALSQPAWQRTDDALALQAPDVPLRAPVRAGTTTLPLAVVQALTAGDVVPVMCPLFDLAGAGELGIANGLAKAVLQLGNQPALELTEWHPTTKGRTMNDLLDAPHDSNADDALDELPVTLSFDLGTLELTLAQLKDLGPGSVLRLAGALPPQVVIRAGTRRVGTGELVELDGRLAVEIRRMGAVS